MNCVKIEPSQLKGEISPPSSKSLCHRAIIAAGLSQGSSRISNVVFSEDILATREAMEGLGVSIKKSGDSILVEGSGKLNPSGSPIDCRESGSTLRFLIPLGAVTGESITFLGKGRLVSRPLDPYYHIFKSQGIGYTTDGGKLPLTIEGRLNSGEFHIRGDISSQFITGLMFSLPLLDGDSSVVVTSELESKGYVDLTIDVLKKFSVDIVNENYQRFIIKGGQKYRSCDYTVEGDFSQGAFWLAAGLLNGDISLTGLDAKNSLQGDRVILDLIKEMGGNIALKGDKILAKTSQSSGIEIDASQCPDLVPILAVLGALSEGRTRIKNAGRLRIKESDRLKAVAAELNKLGAHVTEGMDELLIDGVEMLEGGTVDSWNDHRIAMAMAVASLKCKNPVTITNSSSIKKSYPEFFEDFSKLGGKVYEWNMG